MGDEKLSCDVIFCPEVSGDTYEVSHIHTKKVPGPTCPWIPLSE